MDFSSSCTLPNHCVYMEGGERLKKSQDKEVKVVKISKTKKKERGGENYVIMCSIQTMFYLAMLGSTN